MARIPTMNSRKSDGRYAVNLPGGRARKRTVYLGADKDRADELYRRTIA